MTAVPPQPRRPRGLDPNDPFDRYQGEVNALYDGARSRDWSQAFEFAPEVRTPATIARAFLNAVASPKWAKPYKLVPSNWDWRPGNLPSTRDGGEVGLERSIHRRALESELDTWTFQMSTMSGVTGPTRHRRRSIDLVHEVGVRHFEFIELKTTSNDPGHAAFEILFYGLAYCYTRPHVAPRIARRHRVLEANTIDLVVLAPSAWYDEGAAPYKLDRLTRYMNEVLEQVRLELPLDGLALSFAFREFDTPDALLNDVAANRAIGREYV